MKGRVVLCPALSDRQMCVYVCVSVSEERERGKHRGESSGCFVHRERVYGRQSVRTLSDFRPTNNLLSHSQWHKHNSPEWDKHKNSLVW